MLTYIDDRGDCISQATTLGAEVARAYAEAITLLRGLESSPVDPTTLVGLDAAALHRLNEVLYLQRHLSYDLELMPWQPVTFACCKTSRIVPRAVKRRFTCCEYRARSCLAGRSAIAMLAACSSVEATQTHRMVNASCRRASCSTR